MVFFSRCLRPLAYQTEFLRKELENHTERCRWFLAAIFAPSLKFQRNRFWRVRGPSCRWRSIGNAVMLFGSFVDPYVALNSSSHAISKCVGRRNKGKNQITQVVRTVVVSWDFFGGLPDMYDDFILAIVLLLEKYTGPHCCFDHPLSGVILTGEINRSSGVSVED